MASSSRRLRYRLRCGRDVSVEGCCVTPSALEVLSGGKETIRARIIERLPERARRLFPWGSENGVFVKPVPEDELPAYAFMVHLLCYQPVSDPDSDMSSLIVCWLGDDIEATIPVLIERQICDVDWDKYAVNGSI